MLRGIVRRLPCSMLPDRSTPEPEDIYRRVGAPLVCSTVRQHLIVSSKAEAEDTVLL